MGIIAVIFTLLACVLHFYFFVLETFLWTKPYGLSTFRMSKEKADSSKVLAANQGIYNALLAAGLLLSFMISDINSAMAIRLYCLAYMFFAGCYGSYSLKTIKVFIFQALPALIGFIANAIIWHR